MRIYYASDLHGSDKCWRKFLAAPKYYKADVIIIGGDITGKFIVPIVHKPDGKAEATFMGVKRKLGKPKDIEAIKEQIANAGQYAVDLTPDQYAQFEANPGQLDALFRDMLCARVAEWVAMADERLKGQNVRCFISAGNDDIFDVDAVLAKSQTIEVHDGRIVDLAEGFQMFGLSYANMTPWKCPRDITEEELGAKIEPLAKQIKSMDRALFDLHVPPYDTGIDAAPELTADMRIVLDPAGTPKMIPVGSTAVREALLKYQPLLGMHGHIHESAGIRKLGRTTIVNPGSEYAEGILRGALIDLSAEEGIVNINLVTG